MRFSIKYVISTRNMGKQSQVKSTLHPRNLHRSSYDFEVLLKANPKLEAYVHENKYGKQSIDFFLPAAVKALNKALLICYYDIQYWDIPKGYLCPAVPGRADYVHYIADVFPDKIRNTALRCLDIGVGANCVYPIIASHVYNWDVVGTDTDKKAFESAQKIVNENARLNKKVELRFQDHPQRTLHGILEKKEYFDVVISNPPFHESQAEADKSAKRKLKNLKGGKSNELKLNFEGQSNELWTEGGEIRFILQLIEESYLYRAQLQWISSLVSKEKTLNKCLRKLKKKKVVEQRVIEMGTSNKKTRILAWRW